MAVGAVAVGAVAVEVCVAFLPTSSVCGRSEAGAPLPHKASGSVYSLPQPRQTASPLLIATHLCTETAAVQQGNKETGAHLWIVRDTGNSFWHGCHRTQQDVPTVWGTKKKTSDWKIW